MMKLNKDTSKHSYLSLSNDAKKVTKTNNVVASHIKLRAKNPEAFRFVLFKK